MKISSYTEFCKVDSMEEHETEGFLVSFQEYSDAGLWVTVTDKKTSKRRKISIKELWELLCKELPKE